MIKPWISVLEKCLKNESSLPVYPFAANIAAAAEADLFPFKLFPGICLISKAVEERKKNENKNQSN